MRANHPETKEIGMRAADVMQKGIISVSPELSVLEFEEFLTSEEISGVPVCGTMGQILGIASKTDIIRVLSEEKSDQMRELLQPDLTVGDIMTREIVTVRPDEDVREVARRMIDGHLHRVMVVTSEDVVGIITTFDLLKLLS
jgi:CBS domain-containing protein